MRNDYANACKEFRPVPGTGKTMSVHKRTYDPQKESLYKGVSLGWLNSDMVSHRKEALSL